MNNNSFAIIFIIFIASLMVLLMTNCKSNSSKNVEGFYTNYGYYKRYCPSVGWRSRYSCAKCVNAGYCITPNGTGECVPGDSSGPYFRRDCQYWEYGDPYYYIPFNILPTVSVRSIYPYYRYNIRKPWRWQNKNHQMLRRTRRPRRSRRSRR